MVTEPKEKIQHYIRFSKWEDSIYISMLKNGVIDGFLWDWFGGVDDIPPEEKEVPALVKEYCEKFLTLDYEEGGYLCHPGNIKELDLLLTGFHAGYMAHKRGEVKVY